MFKKARFTIRLFVISFLLIATSCGAVNSTTAIIDARNQIKQAKAKEADIYAPYEYTKAVLFLKKAKELQGYTEYQQSVVYAINAKDNAQKAITNAYKRKQKLEKIKRLKEQYRK